MTTGTDHHLLTFAALLDVWDTATATARAAGLTDEQAAAAVGAWLDARLDAERHARLDADHETTDNQESIPA